MSYAIEINNLVKKYGRHVILDSLNMHVPKGAIYGFIGVNGAGKSTTFGVLSGFLPYQKGTFSIQGSLSVFPQDTKLYDSLTVKTQLQFFAELNGFRGIERTTEVDRVLSLVNMLDARNKRPHKLSHGMNKRVAIAQSFIGNPDIILLDEPIAGLDPQNAHEMKQLIKKLAATKTILVSSHTLSDISALCDVVGLIHKGKMQFEGPIDQLTQMQSKISFHITSTVKPLSVKNISAITDVMFDSKTKELTIAYNSQEVETDDIIRKVVEELYAHNIGILAISRGETLEESFLKMVNQ